MVAIQSETVEPVFVSADKLCARPYSSLWKQQWPEGKKSKIRKVSLQSNFTAVWGDEGERERMITLSVYTRLSTPLNV